MKKWLAYLTASLLPTIFTTMLFYVYFFHTGTKTHYYIILISGIIASSMLSASIWNEVKYDNGKMLRIVFKLRTLWLYLISTTFLCLSLAFLGASFWLGWLYINNIKFPLLAIPFFVIVAMWPYYMFLKNKNELSEMLHSKPVTRSSKLVHWSMFCFASALLSFVLCIAYMAKHFYTVPNAYFVFTTFSCTIILSVVGEALRNSAKE